MVARGYDTVRPLSRDSLPAPFPDATCLALDIETDPTKDQALVVLAVSDGEDTLLVDLREHEPFVLQTWLKHDVYNRKIIGHNLGFDLMHLHDNFICGYPADIYDTMVAEQLLTAGLQEFDRVGLDDVLQRYCQVYLDKSLQTSFRVDEEMTPEQIEYAKGDVIELPTVMDLQLMRIKHHKLEDVLRIELAILPIFAEMGRVGVYIDMDLMGPLLEENRRTRDRLKAELQLVLTEPVMWKRMRDREEQERDREIWQSEFDRQSLAYESEWDWYMHDNDAWDPDEEWIKNKWDDQTVDKKDNKPKGMKRYVREKMSTRGWRKDNPIPKLDPIDSSLINLNSSQQMLIAFGHFGLEPVDLDGKATTGKKTLEGMLADATEEQRNILIPYLAYRKAEKIDTAFGDRLIERRDAGGRVHAYFKQIGTQTGRPVVVQPNLNQMPNDPKFRACFRAEQGDVLVVADYQQMELRIIAQLSRDENMMDAFRKGLDLHTYTASLMFNVPFEEVTSKQRKTAKTINFGILYGMGPKKLRGTLMAEGIEMSFPEAKDAIKRWKEAYPRAAAKIQEWGEQVLTLGYTATPYGRKRFFNTEFEEDGDKYAAMRAGANHPIQGTNADITKAAMYGIHKHLGDRGEIILQVYDEIVVQCREGCADWVKALVESYMLTAAETVLKDVPAGVDAVISRSWSEDDAVAA